MKVKISKNKNPKRKVKQRQMSLQQNKRQVQLKSGNHKIQPWWKLKIPHKPKMLPKRTSKKRNKFQMLTRMLTKKQPPRKRLLPRKLTSNKLRHPWLQLISLLRVKIDASQETRLRSRVAIQRNPFTLQTIETSPNHRISAQVWQVLNFRHRRKIRQLSTLKQI